MHEKMNFSKRLRIIANLDEAIDKRTLSASCNKRNDVTKIRNFANDASR